MLILSRYAMKEEGEKPEEEYEENGSNVEGEKEIIIIFFPTLQHHLGEINLH